MPRRRKSDRPLRYTEASILALSWAGGALCSAGLLLWLSLSDTASGCVTGFYLAPGRCMAARGHTLLGRRCQSCYRKDRPA